MKLGVIGAHGTGKSTLVDAFIRDRRSTDRCWGHVEEAARSTGRTFQSDIDRKQRAIIEKTYYDITNASPYTIFDRTPFDSWIYTLYFAEAGSIRDTSLVDTSLEYHIETVDLFDGFIFIDKEFDLVDDGFRHTCTHMHNTVVGMYQELVPALNNVYRVSGTVSQRVDAVYDIIKELDSQA